MKNKLLLFLIICIINSACSNDQKNELENEENIYSSIQEIPDSSYRNFLENNIYKDNWLKTHSGIDVREIFDPVFFANHSY